MSEEFEQWFSEELKVRPQLWFLQDKQTLKTGWNAATEAMQAKLDAQAAEMAVLRGFTKWVYMETLNITKHNYYSYALKVNGLIDADGNPTPLLNEIRNETMETN